MDVQYVDIEELKECEYNPRKFTAKKESELEESIKKYGLVEPIIVNSAENRKNIIIGGHFRYRVAKKLGIKKIPVVYIDIPDIEKELEKTCIICKKAYNKKGVKMDRDKYVVRSYSTTRKSDYELIKLAKLKRKSVSEIVRCAVEEYLQKEYNAKN